MISTGIRRAGPYATNGSQVAFEFSFKVFESSDLRVLFAVSGDPEADVDAGDYTVTLNLDQDTEPGGEIVFAVPPVDGLLSIISDMLIEQPAVFSNTGNFYPRVLNDALDRATIGIQQLDEKVDRAAIAPVVSDSQLGYFPVLDGQGGFAFLPPEDVGGEGLDPTLRVELAATAGGGLLGTLDGTAQANLNTRPVIVNNRTALKALVVTRYSAALMLESGRISNFMLVAGSTPTDAQEGIYVASDTAGYYWERIWDKIHAKAEWFGAVAATNTTPAKSANVTALHAALDMCSIVLLEANDYYVNATVKHNYANTRLRGAGSKYNGTYGTQATRLIIDNGTEPAIQFGPDSNPGGISVMQQGVKADGFFATRSVAPSVPAGAATILAQFLLEAYFEDITAYEGINGWVFNGTVSTKAFRCSAQRATAGTGGTDAFKGFYVLGTSGIAAGGNASLSLIYCHADDNRSSVVDGVGFYADGKFTDCYWDSCETVSCTVGMEVNGNGAATNDYGNTDLMISKSVNDASKVYGIYVHAMGVSGSVNITDPYVGVGAAATAAIEINGGYGVRVTGGQIIMGVGTAANGIRLENSESCDIDGAVITESTLAAVVTNNITNCRIAPVLKNKTVTGAEAVQINGSAVACKFEAMVSGKASAFTYGYRIIGTAITFTGALVAATSATLTANWTGETGVHSVVFSDGSIRDVTLTNGATTATWSGAVTASTAATASRVRDSEFNCSGVNSRCLNGGAGLKFVVAGAQVTTAYTPVGTNTPTGVMT